MVRGSVEYESKRPDVPDQLRVNPKLKVRKCIDMMMMVPMTMMGVLMMLTIGLYLEEENKLRVDKKL